MQSAENSARRRPAYLFLAKKFAHPMGSGRGANRHVRGGRHTTRRLWHNDLTSPYCQLHAVTAQKHHRHPKRRHRQARADAASPRLLTVLEGSNPTQLVSLLSTRSATRCHARWRSLLSRLPAPSGTATGAPFSQRRGRRIRQTAGPRQNWQPRSTRRAGYLRETAESAGEALLAAAPTETSPSKSALAVEP